METGNWKLENGGRAAKARSREDRREEENTLVFHPSRLRAFAVNFFAGEHHEFELRHFAESFSPSRKAGGRLSTSPIPRMSRQDAKKLNSNSLAPLASWRSWRDSNQFKKKETAKSRSREDKREEEKDFAFRPSRLSSRLRAFAALPPFSVQTTEAI